MPRLKHWMVALFVLIGVLAPTLTAQAVVSSVGEFDNTWARTDLPVSDGDVNRTWMWGPAPFTEPGTEQYVGVPGNERVVQYFDKSRMEINDPNGDPSSPWFVTNGLLVVEMTSGDMHTGFDERQYRGPATVNVAGDADDPTGPTYATIGNTISEDPVSYSQGDVIDEVIDREGWDAVAWFVVGEELASYGVTAAEYSPITGKYTASVFWEFMNSTALVYENGSLVNAPLFQDPYYATGLPIDQPWWAEVKVAGTYKWVLMQCFERRCLTYTPDNPAGWQVEAGNVGQHYYEWRYGGDPVDPPMSENDYIDAVIAIDDKFLASVEFLDLIWEDFDPYDATWVQLATAELAYWSELSAEMDALNPPANYADMHQMFLDAYVSIVDASYLIENGIIEDDSEQILDGWEIFDIGWVMLEDAFDVLLANQPQLTEAEYLELVWTIDDAFLESVDTVDLLWEDFNLDDPNWISALFAEFEYWRELARWMGQIDPPDSYGSVHLSFLEAYALIEQSTWLLEDGLVQQDVNLLTEGWSTFDSAWAILDEIFATLPTE